jgi:hypothetical protein
MSQAPLPSLIDDVSADSTFTDLEPITGEIAAVADSSIELSSTDLEDELSADETGEIEPADILEVASALRTSRLPALSLRTSRLPVPTPRMPSVAPAAPRPSYPSSSSMAARAPSSIAPFALDVSAPMRPSFPSSPTSTLQIARAAGLPGHSPRVVMVAASVLGMCLFAAVAGAALGYSRPTPVTASGAPVAAPRVAEVETAHEVVALPMETASAKDPSAPGEPSEEVPVPAPAPRVPVRANVAPHPPVRAVAPAPAAGNTGTIRVSAPLSGVLVDGTPHKVVGGGVVVACGRHMVKAPGQSARLVIVPCGGRATF